MKLSRELKTKINRTAHAAGVAHAEKVRAALIAEALAGLLTSTEEFQDAPTMAGVGKMDDLIPGLR